ncbi:MAG: FAD-dependent oxidoreductase, partial [Spirochaetia bacterium]|nr:FAD-dependent oxidoreductase [Spirochaetia bacterium]
HGVELKLGKVVSAPELLAQGFDEVVLATGVTPRKPSIPGIDGPNVLSYVDVVLRGKPVGHKVAVMGAGGIGYDVTLYLTDPANRGDGSGANPEEFFAEWGIDPSIKSAGGLATARKPKAARDVVLLKRSKSKFGSTLGKTTGWIHKKTVEERGVRMISGVEYQKIDEKGIWIKVKDKEELIPADTIVVCAGQESRRDLYDALVAGGRQPHLIGGADVAAELDAKRAIDQGARLAASL